MRGLIAAAIKRLNEAEYDSPEHHAAARSVREGLDSAATDTLNALVEVGPLSDGDVPSKAGRDELVALGLATRNIIVKGEDGYQAATHAGRYVWKAGQAT